MIDQYEAMMNFATERGLGFGAASASSYLQGTIPRGHWHTSPGYQHDVVRCLADPKAPCGALSRLLKGLQANDPVLVASLPVAHLSGDERRELLADAIRANGLVHTDGTSRAYPYPLGHAPGTCPVCDWYDAVGGLADAYEEAYARAARAEVERLATDLVSEIAAGV